MDEALKPCPFCGSAGTYENARGSYGYYPAKLRIRCADEGCYGQTGWLPHGEQDYDTTPVARQKAATAWNTRADTAPTPKADEVEAVGFAMWKAEADRAAPNVGKNRTIENYRYDLDPIGRAKWDQIALAAIAALDAARGDPVARVVEWLRAMKRDDTNWPQHIAFLIDRGEPFNG